VNQRTGIINQIRAFLLERGIAVRQGQRFLRAELPRILSTPPEVLSPRMVRMIEGLTGDWRRLDERIDGLFGEIGRIQMRKTDPLHLLTFGLHRTAGPYRWVKSTVFTVGGPLPVFLRKQTFSKSVDMSQRCQKRTHARELDRLRRR